MKQLSTKKNPSISTFNDKKKFQHTGCLSKKDLGLCRSCRVSTIKHPQIVLTVSFPDEQRVLTIKKKKN